MSHDRRLTFARRDLADVALEGRVEAARFAEPVLRRVIAPLADLRREPRLDSGIDTQALMGEAVRVLEEDAEGFAFVQLARDSYVGYLPSAALGPAEPAPTHRVSAIRTFLYPGPSLKLPIAGYLSFGARVAVSGWSGDYAQVPGAGFVHGAHLAPVDSAEPDFVALAERFLETPYLWGGKSSLGIDCSGLVQIALQGAGHEAPRDSDMQAAGLGRAIPIEEEGAPERGDLVFWGGHVGLLLDEATLLHANGHHMKVAAEPLEGAIARIVAKSFGAVTGWRRIGIERGMRRLLDPLLALLGIAAIAFSLIGLAEATRGVGYAPLTIAGTPARVYRAPLTQPGPAVVIAHGFAGSQQLMGAFATTLARAGYIAITFDFAGHGANPTPLGGSVDDLEGATQVLVEETRRVAEVARALGDGRLAILGHSMASDIVVRAAQQADDIAATIAVSMFSPAVTADSPANLLVIAGEWEGRLREEALRAVALALPEGEVAREGVTYGDFGEGTARRAVSADNVEHVGVLFSTVTLGETRAWLDATFGRESPPDAHLDGRGPFVVLLLLGSVLLARPLSRLLPAVVPVEAGGGLPWRFFWIVLLVPMVLTPIVLTFVPTQILPVLVADYLVAHFALYGLLTALSLLVARRIAGIAPSAPRVAFGRFALASLAAIAYFGIAFAAPIDLFLTAFAPVPHRVPLVGAILIGTASFFLADAWATHGPQAARGAYPATKAAFLVSLAIAVALDFERLLFLLIIVPVVVAFMIVFGAVGAFVGRATRHPAVPGLLNALVFAYALGVTFPLLSGR